MSELYSRQTAKRGLRQTLLLRPVSQVLTAASLILLVRALPEEDYGIYALLLSVLAFAGLVLSLGIANMVQRFVPEYARRGEYTRVKRLAASSLLLRFLSIAGLLLVLFVFRDPLIRLYDLQGYEYLFLPLVPVVLAHFQCRILMQILPALMFQGAALYGQVALAGIKCLGYLAMLWSGAGLTVVLWIDLGAYAVMLLILAWSYQRRVHPLSGGPETLGAAERKRLFRYAAFYNFNDIGVLGLGRDIDNLFLGALTNPVAVGAYALAGKLTEVLLRFNPMHFFYTVIQPLFFTLDIEADRARLQTLFGIMLKAGFLVMIPLWSGIAAGIEPIIRVVLAGKFEEFAWVVTTVMGFKVLSMGVARPSSLVAQLNERSDIVFYSKIFSFLNLGLNLVVIPLYGLLGVVLATGLCTLAKDLFVWWFVRDLARPRHLGYFTAVTLGLWGSYILIGRLLQGVLTSDIAILAILTVLGLIWSLAYLRLALRTPEEMAEIQTLTGGNRRVLRLMGIRKGTPS